ncbi:MAG: DUF222 domain-containing protein, partial [Acidobacteriota bacterium]|nr:DUF222 domain-containing protein [Acidobacteriota bacterium]
MAVRQSIGDYAKTFEADRLSGADAARVVSLCAAIEASVSSVKSLAAARMAETGSWRTEGYRSAEEQLADRAGIGTGLARRQLHHAKRLSEHPEVAQAALSGELSAEPAELVAMGADADRSKTAGLIDKARSSSVGELRDEVAQVRADHVDREAQRRRIHAARKLRSYTDLEGAWRLVGTGNVEDGMTLAGLLTPIRQRLNRLRRDAGQDLQSFEQLDYDALVTVARIACGRDGELSLLDLRDLGLFSQMDLPTAPPRTPATTTPPGPVPPGPVPPGPVPPGPVPPGPVPPGSIPPATSPPGGGAHCGTGPRPPAGGSGTPPAGPLDRPTRGRSVGAGAPSGTASLFDDLVSPPAAQPGTPDPAGLPPAGLSPVGIPPAALPSAGLSPAGVPPAGVPSADLPSAGLSPAGLFPVGVPPAALPSAALPSAGLSSAGLFPGGREEAARPA